MAEIEEGGVTHGRAALGWFALAWLLAAVVGGYAAATMEPFHVVRVPGIEPARHGGLAHHMLDPWQHWDGLWYLRIARSGYAADGSAAFFPLYPGLIRAVAPLTGGDALAAALLISWLSLAGALVVLDRLLSAEFGRSVATTALLLLVSFPTAFYFHAAYTESLFLLLAAGSFLAARRRRWLLAGFLGLLAGLTRSAGLLFAPVLAIEAWSQTHANGAPGGWRALASRAGLAALARAPGRSLLGAAIPLLAVPALLVLFDRTLDDPLAFSSAQRLWERHPAAPWSALYDGIRVLLPGGPRLLEPIAGAPPRLDRYVAGFLESNAYNLAAALGGLALAGLALRRLPASFGAFALGGVLLPLFSPSRVLPLYSMPRFLLVLFPLFVALALPLEARPRLRSAVLIASAALQGLFTVRFALWYWVA